MRDGAHIRPCTSAFRSTHLDLNSPIPALCRALGYSDQWLALAAAGYFDVRLGNAACKIVPRALRRLPQPIVELGAAARVDGGRFDVSEDLNFRIKSDSDATMAIAPVVRYINERQAGPL
ncbi:MAG: hypothetical protein ABI619_07810 [Betaproteobacteria bacterium]